MFIENMPDEIELLSFFESEPVSFERENISSLYSVRDDNGIGMDFSFSVVEGWVQYVIKYAKSNIVHNAIDGVGSFVIRKDELGEYIYIEIITSEEINKTEIRVKPYISVTSSRLVK